MVRTTERRRGVWLGLPLAAWVTLATTAISAIGSAAAVIGNMKDLERRIQRLEEAGERDRTSDLVVMQRLSSLEAELRALVYEVRRLDRGSRSGQSPEPVDPPEASRTGLTPIAAPGADLGAADAEAPPRGLALPPCASRGGMAALLEGLGERRAAGDDGALALELWARPDLASWSIVLVLGDLACIVAIGELPPLGLLPPPAPPAARAPVGDPA